MSLLPAVPVRYFAFDLLAIGNTNHTSSPYLERRQALDELAAASTSDVLVVPPPWRGVDPRHMLAAAADQSVEKESSRNKSTHNIFRVGRETGLNRPFSVPVEK